MEPRERGKLKNGDVVIFHDPHGEPHNALVTNAWSGDLAGAINIAFVNAKKGQDPYGDQIDRESSVTHVSKTNVHGRYWRLADEEAREYVAPASA